MIVPGTRRNRSSLLLAVLLGAIPLVAGCEPENYSAELRYPLRSDPIVLNTNTLKDSDMPDRPGVLPIMNLKTLDLATHPLHSLLAAAKPLDPTALNAEDRAALQGTLLEMFGTPREPRVEGGSDPDTVQKLQTELGLTAENLKEGSRLFRLHCLHCHGLTGDGRGPTAFWINPHPRDYRKGKFKFGTTGDPNRQGQPQKPTVADLNYIIRYGLDGTAMPAFNPLPDAETRLMALYVIHLSLRGEIEEDTMTKLLKNERDWGDGKTMQDYMKDGLKFYGEQWLIAPQRVVVPDPYPYKNDPDDPKGEFAQSVKRGWEIYNMKGSAPCFQCHEDFGRKSKFKYDDWGTMVRPADLTTGVFRGGRRPLDLYLRIYNGVPGSGMPSNASLLAWTADEKKDANNLPKTNKLWDMVNFLQVLPYPQMREKYGIQIN